MRTWFFLEPQIPQLAFDGVFGGGAVKSLRTTMSSLLNIFAQGGRGGYYVKVENIYARWCTGYFV